MKRREFLSFGAATLAIAPALLSAKDFRKEKPDVWTTKNVYDGDKPTEKGVEEAIKKLYGDVKPEEKGIKLKTPEVANNGGQIPIGIKSDIAAKTVAVFQDVNPESAVAVFTVPDGQPVDYLIKIKMKKTGTVTVILEGKDGKFYKASNHFKVALGGCEG